MAFGTYSTPLLFCFFQVNLLKKGLRHQAEGILTFSGQCQHLYSAQMQLVDLLPDAPPTLSGDEAEKEKEGAVLFAFVCCANGRMLF